MPLNMLNPFSAIEIHFKNIRRRLSDFNSCNHCLDIIFCACWYKKAYLIDWHFLHVHKKKKWKKNISKFILLSFRIFYIGTLRGRETAGQTIFNLIYDPIIFLRYNNIAGDAMYFLPTTSFKKTQKKTFIALRVLLRLYRQLCRQF